MTNDRLDITPELEAVIEAIKAAHGLEDIAPLPPRVLLLEEGHPTPVVRQLMEHLEQAGLRDRVLVVGADSSVPPHTTGIEHVIKALQDREAMTLSLALPQEPAWLTEQHNRKPSPRKR